MTDAAHNQHSEARPPERSRPHHNNRAQPVSSPPVQKCCAEMMSVSVAGIPKNRCRTTVAERMGGNASGTAPLPGTKSVCLGRNQAARTGGLAGLRVGGPLLERLYANLRGPVGPKGLVAPSPFPCIDLAPACDIRQYTPSALLYERRSVTVRARE
jgi:hypothetical protein